MKWARPKVYGYVSSETCVSLRFARPGEKIDDKPAHKHGDFFLWTCGKRATLKIINDPKEIGYNYRAARLVALRLGWIEREY